MMRVPGSYIHTLHKSTGRSILYGEYYCPPWAYRQGPARRLPCAEHPHTGNILAESPSAVRAMLSPSDAPNRGGARALRNGDRIVQTRAVVRPSFRWKCTYDTDDTPPWSASMVRPRTVAGIMLLPIHQRPSR